MSWQKQAVNAIDHYEIIEENEQGIELLADGLVTDEITELATIANDNNLMLLVTGQEDGEVLITLKTRA